MSVQEDKLKAIADAIREKDGSTETIPASSFPERIRDIPAGGLPEDVFTITVEADPPEGGMVSGGGVASLGMTVTVKADVANGYKFKGWEEGTEEVSVAENYTFDVTKSRNLIASLEENKGHNLPEGYTELEYIESTKSNQYINLGISGSGLFSLKIVADILPMGDSGALFGSVYPYSSSSWYKYGVIMNTNGIQAAMGTTTDTTITTDTSSRRMKVVLDCLNGTAAVNDESISIVNYSYMGGNFKPLYLLARNRGGTLADTLCARLYSCEIYDSTGLTRHLVPCINSAGTVGLFNLVNNAFFGGVGSFTAGPAL